MFQFIRKTCKDKKIPSTIYKREIKIRLFGMMHEITLLEFNMVWFSSLHYTFVSKN